MNKLLCRFAWVPPVLLIIVWMVTVKFSIPVQAVSQTGGPQPDGRVAPGVSAPVWSLPLNPEAVAGGRKKVPKPRRKTGYTPDPRELENLMVIPLPGISATLTPVLALGFDGISQESGGSGEPPDTNGDVGPNHYVQMVNSAFSIYNKTGNLLQGPVAINALWPAGDSTPCRISNQGDPIVLYDPLANRWVMSQFNFADNGQAPFYECLAVSQTPDPMGSWYTYSFNTGGAEMNDYPKLGVWPDGYYMGTNESGFTAYVFDRANMITGGVARPLQRFNVPGQNMMLPADLDGRISPPAGSPNYFYTMKTANRIELWRFSVDWNTPANSTFQSLVTLTSSGFSFDVCPATPADKGVFECIPQQGVGQTVDAIGEWPMFRFQYRNLGSHEALVGNFTTDVDPSAGSDRAAIHWFELRKPAAGGSWTIRNEGNYSPDSHHRWTGSAAMDRDGNLAVAYSVSSSSMFPALRYTTRLAGDPANQLGAEASMQAGGASQTSSNRWGDYGALTVDPADDCTFWFTSEYLTSSAQGWRTRIAAFKIPQCGAVYLPLIRK